jgi:glutamyl-tRNA reductase
MYLLVSGINHKTAPISIRDQLSKCSAEIKDKLSTEGSEMGITEFFILSTCNRFEIYLASNEEYIEIEKMEEYIFKLLKVELRDHLKYKSDDLNDYLYQYRDLKVVDHLYRVASGMDSLVKGEVQILAQIKEQYRQFKEQELTSTYLNQLCTEAIRVGKLVRTKTKICEKAVSVSYAAVELARNLFGDLSGEKVMILGAGETAELTLKNLLNYGVEGILVANRSYQRGNELAEKYGGEVIKWEQFKDKTSEVDIIIASTAAPHTLLHKEDLLQAVESRHGPIFLIDIALPRDIDQDVDQIAGVHLYNIDDLKLVVEKNLDFREGESEKAEKIIAEEKYKFENWLRERSCVPIIREMRRDAHRIKEAEVERALHLLRNSEAEAEQIIEELGHRLLNKIMHQPTVGLKELAVEEESGAEKLKVVKKIFAVGD